MNLYGHHYTRVAYNGEIYDERVETTAWDSRRYFDPVNQDFIVWDEGVVSDLRAEFAFLLRENEIYMRLAQTLDEELRALISDLERQND